MWVPAPLSTLASTESACRKKLALHVQPCSCKPHLTGIEMGKGQLGIPNLVLLPQPYSKGAVA